MCVTVVSPSLHVQLTVSPVVCVMRACFQVCQMVTECGTLISEFVSKAKMSACLRGSVTVHLWFLSDGVDVRLCSCNRFWVAISGQFVPLISCMCHGVCVSVSEQVYPCLLL